MSSIDSRIDWAGLKQCLATLHRESPEFLTQSILIGGGACWFYRVQLQSSRDPDFKFPEINADEEKLWLSKDIDFTGIFKPDAFRLLPNLISTDTAGSRFLMVNGIRLGFAQVGVTFNPEEEFVRARIAEFEEGRGKVQFLVMDPISLYREKQALTLKRNQPNDHAHFRVLKEFLHLEFTRTTESLCADDIVSDVEQRQELISSLLDFKNRAVEIAQNPRVRSRLERVTMSPAPGSDIVRRLFLEE